MRLQPPSEFGRVGRMNRHPSVESAHPSLKQVAHVGVRSSAKMHFLGENLGHEVFAAYNNPSNQIGVTTEIFCS